MSKKVSIKVNGITAKFNGVKKAQMFLRSLGVGFANQKFTEEYINLVAKCYNSKGERTRVLIEIYNPNYKPREKTKEERERENKRKELQLKIEYLQQQLQAL